METLSSGDCGGLQHSVCGAQKVELCSTFLVVTALQANTNFYGNTCLPWIPTHSRHSSVIWNHITRTIQWNVLDLALFSLQNYIINSLVKIFSVMFQLMKQSMKLVPLITLLKNFSHPEPVLSFCFSSPLQSYFYHREGSVVDSAIKILCSSPPFCTSTAVHYNGLRHCLQHLQYMETKNLNLPQSLSQTLPQHGLQLCLQCLRLYGNQAYVNSSKEITRYWDEFISGWLSCRMKTLT